MNEHGNQFGTCLLSLEVFIQSSVKKKNTIGRDQMHFFILLLFSLTKVAGVSDTKKAFLRMCTADLQISHAGRITLSTKNSSETYLDQFSLLFVCVLLQIIDLKKKKNVFLLLYASFFTRAFFNVSNAASSVNSGL